MKKTVKVAIIQDSPVYFNLEESVKKAVWLIEEAASKDANLIVFGEAWFTGYPAWLDWCPDIALWDHEPTKKVFQKMWENAVEVGGNETEKLSELSKKNNSVICIGVNEKITKGPANGTIFNTMLIFGEDGQLKVHHRKLMPTFTEKLVYGHGDAYGLKSIETFLGNIGGLICWEHWMPFARYALHNDGEHIHIALWPKVHEIHQLASKHYAFEGRCWTIAVGQIMLAQDLPSEFDIPDDLKKKPERMILNGGSCIIAPNGEFALEPQYDVSGIIYFEIDDLAMTIRERLTLDVSGHYNRTDIFQLSINRQRAQT